MDQDRVKSIPLFGGLSRKECKALAPRADEVDLAQGKTLVREGEWAYEFFAIEEGTVEVRRGEQLLAELGPGDFFGEGCLAGQPRRMGSATAILPTTVLRVTKREMMRTLHDQSALSDRFITHMLARNIRVEEDLIDQLFNSSEKRLARTLLLLARYGKQDKPARVVPKISQATLAEMVGTTRSRVNFFLNKFKRLGFIEYNGENPLKINSSLLSVVLHD